MKLYHLDWARGYKHEFHSILTFPGRESGDVLVEGDDVFDSAKTAFDFGFYVEVAEIDSDSPEYAFRYTQNIDEAWSDPPAEGVKPIGEGPFRSTSVGDLVEQDGVFKLVSSIGFKELKDFKPEPGSKPEGFF
ncbi:hypothetical protein [Rhizobium sp. MHM7A]|uniref:hypothetical protein n=1 Tax=Rhizobium sp. MHM7A TaxID=2583233 RepID=UPI00110613FE|nr:hypothetical protein [Rhizobium sp. MHM7A]TLX15942.1 hypothetical protein FFR93_01095 [Rhizobium sp. MHM7A]